MNARRDGVLVGVLWPPATVLWMLTVFAVSFTRARVSSMWGILLLVAFGVCAISGLCSALACGIREDSCRGFLRTAASRVKYLLWPVLLGISCVFVFGSLAKAMMASYGALFLGLVALALTALTAFAAMAGVTGQLRWVGAFRAAAHLIWTPWAICLLLAPSILAFVWGRLFSVMAGQLDADTIDKLNRTAISVTNGFVTALLVDFVRSRLAPSEIWSVAAKGVKCVIKPARAVVAAWLGALLYAVLLESAPRGSISWGAFLPSGGVPGIINVPFSVGTLVVAVVGIAVIAEICAGDLPYVIPATVAARMVFVAMCQVYGPLAGHGQRPLYEAILGRTAVLWPTQYLVGLGVYGVLSIVWVTVNRRFGRFQDR